MAHLVESIAWTGQKPWHGLGYEVADCLSPIEMMNASKTNWSVEKVPAFINYGGKQVETGRHALVRSSDHKILDVITDDWNPTQNEDAFQFFHEYVEAGHMKMETAGSLDGGRMVWALARIQSQFEAVRGDVVQSYLLFSNPHKYGRAITVRFTPIRVVCNNTLTYALESTAAAGMSVSVNHRQVFNPDEVKKTLNIAMARENEYKEAAQFLATKKYTKDSLVEFVKKVFPKSEYYQRKTDREVANDNELSRPAQTILAQIDSQPGANFAPGTYWSAVNAVTFSADHVLGRNVDSRLHSAWFGVNQQRKLKALQTAITMARAA